MCCSGNHNHNHNQNQQSTTEANRSSSPFRFPMMLMCMLPMLALFFFGDRLLGGNYNTMFPFLMLAFCVVPHLLMHRSSKHH